jgi:hypothetical protein
MPINHSCFISFTTGTGKALQEFIDLLQAQLLDGLKAYVREPAWRFDENERIGAEWQRVLPLRLCQTVCMVAFYVPSYESSGPCIREYVAMEDIEAARLKALGDELDPEFRMIIPVILKKRKGTIIPSWMQSSKLCLDITEYKTPDQPLVKALEHPKCVARLEEIAESVYEVWRAMTQHPDDLCVNCRNELPPVDDERVRERWISRDVFTLPSRKVAT